MDLTFPLLITGITAVASFIQGFTGFGVGLLAMPLLISLLGIRQAAPTGAIIIFTIIVATLLRYRHHLTLRDVMPLWIASVPGIPVGVYALSHVGERLLVTVFGLLIIGYALFALFSPRVPAFRGRLWGPLFGVVAGFCTGAYNGSGPPAIVYGTGRRWEPDRFRSNLQAFFIINSGVVNLTHLLHGNITGAVLRNYAAALPGAAIGLLAGFALAARFRAARFRKTVLWILLLLGVGMLV